MASAILISVGEYLNTSYRPDCDYVDGEIRERNVGGRSHAGMQYILAAVFNQNGDAWGIVAFPEQRVQTSAEHFRILDICVMRSSDPPDEIVRVAPLICVEVLSPSDTFASLQDRVHDYARMGVQHIWVIDPMSRQAFVASDRGFAKLENGEFAVPGTPIRVVLSEVFAKLDKMLTQR